MKFLRWTAFVGSLTLDGGRLARIRERIGGRVKVVLHGTNGFAPETMRQCISAGISKVNVNRLVLDDYYAHLRSEVARLPHTALIEGGIDRVVAQTVEWMEICGSAGKV